MEDLLARAKHARQQAYVPYSDFPVGACVIASNGKHYGGCNIENASYGLTNCAERTAIFAAVAAGAKKIEMLAVIADTQEPITPCGACRQVMNEFMDDGAVIVLANMEGKKRKTTVKQLLPAAFEAGDING